MADAAPLKIKSVIGFNGKVNRALHYSPCGKYLVYPLGSFIVVKNLVTEKEAFVDGHSNQISCLSISNDGSKMASGQIAMPGIKVSYTNAIVVIACSLIPSVWT